MKKAAKQDSHQPNVASAQGVNRGNMRNDKEPTFQALKPSGREATDEFTKYSKTITEPLSICVQNALDVADSAGALFRGWYPIPIAQSDGIYGDRLGLPWRSDHDEVGKSWASVDAEIERFAENLRGEDWSFCATFSSQAPRWSPPEQWVLQSLSVEVMMAIDNVLMSIKAGDLAGALWWQQYANTTLIECHGQADVVLGTSHHDGRTASCALCEDLARLPSTGQKDVAGHLGEFVQ
jgi:hypothetical protein